MEQQTRLRRTLGLGFSVAVYLVLAYWVVAMAVYLLVSHAG